MQIIITEQEPSIRASRCQVKSYPKSGRTGSSRTQVNSYLGLTRTSLE